MAAAGRPPPSARHSQSKGKGFGFGPPPGGEARRLSRVPPVRAGSDAEPDEPAPRLAALSLHCEAAAAESFSINLISDARAAPPAAAAVDDAADAAASARQRVRLALAVPVSPSTPAQRAVSQMDVATPQDVNDVQRLMAMPARFVLHAVPRAA